MMRMGLRAPALACALWLSAGAALGGSPPTTDSACASELSRSGHILPLGGIKQRARSVASGTLLEAELEPTPGGYIYALELATPEGRHLELRFDATTGELIGRR